MRVIQFDSFDGRSIFTNRTTEEAIRKIVRKERDRYEVKGSPVCEPGLPRITILEMSEKEYSETQSEKRGSDI